MIEIIIIKKATPIARKINFLLIKNLEDLRDFKVKKAVIKPNTNNVIKQSYANWKEIVDKHFVKNQE